MSKQEPESLIQYLYDNGLPSTKKDEANKPKKENKND